jgi:hypothetical protein
MALRLAAVVFVCRLVSRAATPRRLELNQAGRCVVTGIFGSSHRRVDVNNLPGCDHIDRIAKTRSEWTQEFELQPSCHQHNEPQRPPRNSLLMLQIAIGSDEHLKACSLRPPKEFAIQNAAPALSAHGGGIMAREFTNELARQVLIQQHPSALWLTRIRHAARGS